MSHVQALSLIQRDTQGDSLVGIIDGAVETPPVRFVVAQLDGCRSISEVASTEIEFDWRTPNSPPGSTNRRLPKRGVVLAGMRTPLGGTWFHYDGFSLRTFAAHEANGAWSITVSRLAVHAEREDVAW